MSECKRKLMDGKQPTEKTSWEEVGRGTNEPKIARPPRIACPYCGEIHILRDESGLTIDFAEHVTRAHFYGKDAPDRASNIVTVYEGKDGYALVDHQRYQALEREVELRRANNERLRAENAAYWRAAVDLESDDVIVSNRGAEALHSIRTGNDWSHTPITVTESLMTQLEQLRADPRLQCPLDGPGSHRMDLQELRLIQAENANLRKTIVALQTNENIYVNALDESDDAAKERVQREMARLRSDLSAMTRRNAELSLRLEGISKIAGNSFPDAAQVVANSERPAEQIS